MSALGLLPLPLLDRGATGLTLRDSQHTPVSAVSVCDSLSHLGPRCVYSIANIWVKGEKSASHTDVFVSC